MEAANRNQPDARRVPGLSTGSYGRSCRAGGDDDRGHHQSVAANPFRSAAFDHRRQSRTWRDGSRKDGIAQDVGDLYV